MPLKVRTNKANSSKRARQRSKNQAEFSKLSRQVDKLVGKQAGTLSTKARETNWQRSAGIY